MEWLAEPRDSVCRTGGTKAVIFTSTQAWRRDHSKDSREQKVEEAEVCPTGKTDNLAVFSPFQRLRNCLTWWQRHGASSDLLETIRSGIQVSRAVQAALRGLHPTFIHKTPAEITGAEEVLTDYMRCGAVQVMPLPPGQPLDAFCRENGIDHLVPWFIITKQEPTGQEKKRLIADCRQINKHLPCRTFKMEHWGHIFPFLLPGLWATKIDLKDAYFHLGLGDALQRCVNLLVGQNIYRFVAAPFGLNILPELWTRLMRVLVSVWRKRGIQCFVYLDDILFVGKDKHKLETDMLYVLGTLRDSGLGVNQKKSVLVPTQQVMHLGFLIDFATGTLGVPPGKLKAVRKDLGKIQTANTMTPRKMAAILGQVRSFIQAIPALRSFTDKMLKFVRLHDTLGWDQKYPIPGDMKEELSSLKDLLQNWKGRPLGERLPHRTIHSDSSDYCWGAKDITTGNVTMEYWRNQRHLHINTKELGAAVQAVQALGQKGDHISLCVDNLVAFHYLRKGGGGSPTSTS